MTTKEFMNGCLVSLGIAGGASVVRAILFPQEGSAWDKFLNFLVRLSSGQWWGDNSSTETNGWFYCSMWIIL